MRTPIQFIETFKPLEHGDVKEGYYEISNMGTFRFKETEEPVKMWGTPDGYLSVSLRKEDGLFKTYRSHRLVADAFCNEVGIDTSDLVVNHKNSDRQENTFYNLEFCTSKENTQHGNRMCRIARFQHIPVRIENREENIEFTLHQGDTNGNAKLTVDQVCKMCEYLEQDVLSYTDILIAMGLEPNKKNLDIMTKIRRGKRWRTVSINYNIPQNKERTPQIEYTDEQIHLICRLLEEDVQIITIGRSLGTPVETFNEKDKFYKFIKRIKRRKTYTHISKDYKF